MNEPTLFDGPLGEALATEAIARADDHADGAWKETALAAVFLCARWLPELTTDDVWALLDDSDESTHERRALGGTMRQAARAGWIEATDRTRKSKRPVCHRNPKAVWRSLVFGGES